MNQWIRRGAIAAATLAALAGATLALGHHLAERRMNRHIELAVEPVPLPGDAATLERGRYLFASRGCTECHGATGGGKLHLDDGHGLRVAGPNITPGPGSAVAHYSAQDWVRTLRHGVKPDGRPALIMPSEDYNRLSDADLGALVAYIRQLPPQSGGAAVLELPLPVRALYGFGMIPDAAAKIDHSLPPAPPVADGVTIEHGAYVANMCIGCHGAHLEGGKVPGGPPDWPAAARLRPGGTSVLPRYPDAAALAAMFRSGHRPDGSPVKVMPFGSLAMLNDVDVRALHLYLNSQPPAP